jgi:hypothetical protein
MANNSLHKTSCYYSRDNFTCDELQNKTEPRKQAIERVAQEEANSYRPASPREYFRQTQNRASDGSTCYPKLQLSQSAPPTSENQLIKPIIQYGSRGIVVHCGS